MKGWLSPEPTEAGTGPCTAKGQYDFKWCKGERYRTAEGEERYRCVIFSAPDETVIECLKSVSIGQECGAGGGQVHPPDELCEATDPDLTEHGRVSVKTCTRATFAWIDGESDTESENGHAYKCYTDPGTVKETIYPDLLEGCGTESPPETDDEPNSPQPIVALYSECGNYEEVPENQRTADTCQLFGCQKVILCPKEGGGYSEPKALDGPRSCEMARQERVPQTPVPQSEEEVRYEYEQSDYDEIQELEEILNYYEPSDYEESEQSFDYFESSDYY